VSVNKPPSVLTARQALYGHSKSPHSSSLSMLSGAIIIIISVVDNYFKLLANLWPLRVCCVQRRSSTAVGDHGQSLHGLDDCLYVSAQPHGRHSFSLCFFNQLSASNYPFPTQMPFSADKDITGQYSRSPKAVLGAHDRIAETRHRQGRGATIAYLLSALCAAILRTDLY